LLVLLLSVSPIIAQDVKDGSVDPFAPQEIVSPPPFEVEGARPDFNNPEEKPLMQRKNDFPNAEAKSSDNPVFDEEKSEQIRRRLQYFKERKKDEVKKLQGFDKESTLLPENSGKLDKEFSLEEKPRPDFSDRERESFAPKDRPELPEQGFEQRDGEIATPEKDAFSRPKDRSEPFQRTSDLQKDILRKEGFVAPSDHQKNSEIGADSTAQRPTRFVNQQDKQSLTLDRPDQRNFDRFASDAQDKGTESSITRPEFSRPEVTNTTRPTADQPQFSRPTRPDFGRPESPAGVSETSTQTQIERPERPNFPTQSGEQTTTTERPTISRPTRPESSTPQSIERQTETETNVLKEQIPAKPIFERPDSTNSNQQIKPNRPELSNQQNLQRPTQTSTPASVREIKNRVNRPQGVKRP
jgi:hypothetical protein